MRRLLFALLLMPLAAAAQPSFVLHNARVYTVDEARPSAEAFAVVDGRIVAVGSEEEIAASHPDLVRLDAGGRTVVPGFIDAHAHLFGLGGALLRANLVGTATKAEVIERLVAFAADLPEDAWLTGRGWDQTDWPAAADGTHPFPTRHDLDAAFPERPVWIGRVDGHAGWANTAAMRAAGIDPENPPADPPGGAILRDAEGHATGIFVDGAEPLIDTVVPAMSEAEREEGLGRALAQTARFGLTGLHEAGVGLDTLRLYKRFIDGGRFTIRNHAMIGGEGATFDAFCGGDARAEFEGGPMGYGDRLAVRSIKLYADGALGSRGAALLSAYSDDADNRGLLFWSGADELQAVVARAMRCGLQINTHAIGDRGNQTVLDAYEAAIAETGGGAGRHRVEHAQVVALDDLPRFAELGIIASVQPTHATSDMPWAETRVGPERIEGAYAWRRLLDSGARLALGSDAPVESIDPLLGFYAAITRQNADGAPPGGWRADQRLTREEALRGFTLDAAYAGFAEQHVGSITPGKWADFVVLSEDIMTIPAPDILETRVVATYLAGEQIYAAD